MLPKRRVLGSRKHMPNLFLKIINIIIPTKKVVKRTKPSSECLSQAQFSTFVDTAGKQLQTCRRLDVVRRIRSTVCPACDCPDNVVVACIRTNCPSSKKKLQIAEAGTEAGDRNV